MFSTENFKRSDEEVNYLMDLFISKFKTQAKKYMCRNEIRRRLTADFTSETTEAKRQLNYLFRR